MKNFNFVLWPTLGGLFFAWLIISQPSLLNSNDLNTSDFDTNDFDPSSSANLAMHSGPVSYSNAVNKAAPAVTNIYTRKIVQPKRPAYADDPFFRRFFRFENTPEQQRIQSSLGSGVIVDARGYLLTNHHVIAGADEIIVALRDGREALATVVGEDPDTDLAILKINLPNLPALPLMQSTHRIGDVVLAIGNPFGVGQTVTMGIISATGRSHLGLTTFEDFIQTDAAINPGNSGGALVNAHGQLIGISTAIYSKSGGSQGIGFAIPAYLASAVMREIIAQGHVSRGWLGIEVKELTRSTVTNAPVGVMVSGLFRNGPAHLAGLQPGDKITHINGEEIQNARQAMILIADTKPGGKVALEVSRYQKILKLKATVGERPRK